MHRGKKYNHKTDEGSLKCSKCCLPGLDKHLNYYVGHGQIESKEKEQEDPDEQQESLQSKSMIPDGSYKAKWMVSGEVSEEFTVTQGKFVLYGNSFQIKCINDVDRFKWGDGTVQQVQKVLDNGNIVWEVLKNKEHKRIDWLKQSDGEIDDQEEVSKEIYKLYTMTENDDTEIKWNGFKKCDDESPFKPGRECYELIKKSPTNEPG